MSKTSQRRVSFYKLGFRHGREQILNRRGNAAYTRGVRDGYKQLMTERYARELGVYPAMFGSNFTAVQPHSTRLYTNMKEVYAIGYPRVYKWDSEKFIRVNE